MGTEHIESYDGHPLTVFTIPSGAGTWQAKAELDLGRTGHVIFENAEATYPSEDEAKRAALALVAQGLACSRIGKRNNS